MPMPLVVRGLLCALVTFTAPASCVSVESVDETSEVRISQPQLRVELLDLFRRDQRIRKELISLVNKYPAKPGETYSEQAMPKALEARAMDAESADFLEQTIEQSGWPTFDQVGKDGAEAAWLIAQHADARPVLQARALELMTAAAAKGQADPAKLAYLTDRVRVASGQKQRYGTQFTSDSEGVERPYPVEDGEPLDLRRAKVGLPPMTHAAKQWGKSLGVKASPVPLDTWPGQNL